MTIGIIGAGLTGLTLGSLIADCEILEKNSVCGGLCRSLEEDSFTFDCGGSHIIFSKDKEVLSFMLEKLGDNIVKCRRNTKILYKGNYVKYPFENGLSDLPLQDNFECIRGFIEVLNTKNRPLNFKDWLYVTFGKGIAENYLIPYNEKIWNYDLSKMSTWWVDGRVPKPPVDDIIKSSLGIETEGYKHQLNFYYPKKGGINALINSLEHESQDKIMKNFDVRSINRENNSWIVSNGIERKRYEKIIATQPIFDIIRSIEEEVPPEIYKALHELKYNSLITVMLGLNVEYLNDFSWLYIPDKDCLAHRVAFPSNYSKMVAPEGKCAVIAEITYNNGDYIDKLSDEELITRTIEELHKKRIIDKDTVCFTKAKRIRFAYVIYDSNYKKNIGMIKAFLNRIGISLVGRFAEFEYLNMDACIRNAHDFAAVIDE